MDQTKTKKHFKFPDTWIVVFCIVAVIALLSWVIPSGAYEYEKIDVNGTTRNVAIAGTYQQIDKAEASPTGFLGLFAALYEGMVSAADIIFVMMVCAATFGVLVKTGAFHAGIGKIMKKLGNKDVALIPVLMLIFALGGSLFGMLSEFYGFYPLVVGLFIALGYDAMVGFAVIALGEYVGFMASTLNPYTVAVAQSVSGVELYSGLGFRWICFVVFMGIAIAYTMIYALRVRKNPAISVTSSDHCVHSFDRSQLDAYTFNGRHVLIMLVVVATLVLLMLGLVNWKWGYKELCGLFIIMSIAVAAIDGWKPDRYCKEMLEGAKSVLWGCILCGLAKSIVVIMSNAKIMDTVIFSLSNLLQNAPKAISAQLMLFAHTFINFLIPSGSGQAAATMPIMAPLADHLGLSRQVACLAFQFGDGLSNLFWPTAGIVTICGLGDVKYDKWMKWFWKLFLIIVAAQMILLEIAVLTGM